MAELDDEQFDVMLRGFLKDSLAPQCGRSERHFRRYLSEGARSAWKQRTWLIGAFATGMAASVAFLWAAPMFRGTTPIPAPTQQIAVDSRNEPGVNASPMIPGVERVVQSHTTDEGVMLFNNETPVRVLHRRQLEQKRWLDQNQQIQTQQSVPEDELLFIKLPTY
jgi:hypothetical protein